MKNIVTTLPIYPWWSPTLSHIISPYIWSLLQKNLKNNLELIVPINLLGEKTKQVELQELKKYSDNYSDLLEKFSIQCDHKRNDIDNKDSINEIIDELYKSWKIYIKEIEIIKCNKGCSEMISIATTFWKKKNTINNNVCNKCNTPLYKENRLWLLFSPTSMDDVKIYSKKFKSFIDNYNNFFYNWENDLYISRTRETGHKYIINWNKFNIDIDFMNACWLTSLKKAWLNPKITLSNPSSLINTYWWINIYRYFSSDSIDLVIHPYIWVNDNNSSLKENILWFKHSKFNLTKIIETNKVDIMKLLIWIWINFKGKDITKVDISNIKKIEKLLKRDIDKDKLEIYSEWLEKILEKINWSNLINAINGKNGKKSIENSEIHQIIKYFL